MYSHSKPSSEGVEEGLRSLFGPRPWQHTSRRSILSGTLAALLLLLNTEAFAKDGAQSVSGETVLLIGASGAIGQFVTRVLESRGCKVRGLTRYPKEAREKLGTSVEWVGGDLLKPETLSDDAFFRKLLAGVDRVIRRHHHRYHPSRAAAAAERAPPRGERRFLAFAAWGRASMRAWGSRVDIRKNLRGTAPP